MKIKPIKSKDKKIKKKKKENDDSIFTSIGRLFRFTKTLTQSKYNLENADTNNEKSAKNV